MHNEPSQIVNSFRGKRIAIIGDAVADQYLHGTISRVSREAPVFILRHDETETRAGAAANAAVNIAHLGGEAVLVGVTGIDANGGLLRENLSASGVDHSLLIADRSIATTTKVRVLAGHQYSARQQVIRIDYENPSALEETLTSKLAAAAAEAIMSADAVIISDYNYGVASDMVAKAAKDAANERKIPLLIDSRFRLRRFTGASSATPNEEEVEQLLGKNFTPNQCVRLREELGLSSLLITRGNRGMLLIQENEAPRSIEAVGSAEPVDVTGAGDTVIAAFSLGLAAGFEHHLAAVVANHAGGIVVMKKGTASVLPDELIGSIRDFEALSVSK